MYSNHNLPMNLPVFVEVLEPLQDFFQNGGNAGLIQHTGLMLAARDDVLDDVQHRACERASERARKRERQAEACHKTCSQHMERVSKEAVG